MLMQSRPHHTRPLNLAINPPDDAYPLPTFSSSFFDNVDFSTDFAQNSLAAVTPFDYSQQQQQQQQQQSQQQQNQQQQLQPQAMRNASFNQSLPMAKDFHAQDWQMFGDNSSPAPQMTQHSNSRTQSQRKHFRQQPQPQQQQQQRQRTFSNDIKKSPLAYPQHLPAPPPPSSSSSQQQQLTSQPMFDNFNINRSQMAAAVAMNSTLEHFGGDNDLPGYAHSAGHSVSSYGHDSPATPRTVNGEERDDAQQMSHGGELNAPTSSFTMPDFSLFDQDFSVPKFDRTMSDIYNDELFMPANYMSNPPAKYQPVNSSLLSPYRQVTEHLQAANLARSASPQEMHRKPSPFRRGSPYAAPLDFGPVANTISTAAGVRQQQKAEADARAYQQHHTQPNTSEPRTISPKDAVLDYQEDVDDLDAPRYPATSGADALFNSRTAFPMTSTQFPFAPSNLSSGLPNDLPLYLSNNVRQNSSISEAAPDYPAQLLSMETSASASSVGAEQIDSSQSSMGKPMGSLTHRGGYTCTAPGCSQRFESAGKLTRHRREMHRTSPASPTIANLAHAHKAGTTQPHSARNSLHLGAASHSSSNDHKASESTSESGGHGSPSSSGSSGSDSNDLPSSTALAHHETAEEGEQHSQHSSTSEAGGPLDAGDDDADDERIGSRMTSAALMARNSQPGPHRCFRTNPSTGKPCDTVFSRPYDLTRHEDTIHNGYKKKVRCHLCVEEKTFSRNDALTRHMRVVHPEVDFPGKHRRRHV